MRSRAAPGQRRSARRRRPRGRPPTDRRTPVVREGGLHVVIVTGLSGSGKSTAIRVLEDLGFYCIDNLPVVLMPKFIELCQNSEEEIARVALGIDVRERGFL